MNFLFVIESIFFVLIALLYVRQIIINRKQKILIENLNFSNKTLNDLYDGIRSFKHDFINFVQALEGYVKCSDIDGISSMANSIYNECKTVCNMEALNPKVINNPAVYNLIANKYQIAHDKNIVMMIEVNCDISSLNIDSYKLCRILGILIDNAIEATTLCDNKKINIRFVKEQYKSAIIIENNYIKENVDLDKIYEKGFTTKSNNKDHGIGLWKVKEIVDKSQNLKLETNVGKMFCQKLIIEE